MDDLWTIERYETTQNVEMYEIFRVIILSFSKWNKLKI